MITLILGGSVFWLVALFVISTIKGIADLMCGK